MFYWLACADCEINDQENATLYFNKANNGLPEPAATMFYNDQQPDYIFYRGLAWGKSGNQANADQIFNNVVRYSESHEKDLIRKDFSCSIVARFADF